MTGVVRQSTVLDFGSSSVTFGTIGFTLNTLVNSYIAVVVTCGVNAGAQVNVANVVDSNTNTYTAYDNLYSTGNKSLISFVTPTGKVLVGGTDKINVRFSKGVTLVGLSAYEIINVNGVVANGSAIMTGGTVVPTSPNFISAGTINNTANQNIFVFGQSINGLASPLPPDPFVGTDFQGVAAGWSYGQSNGNYMMAEAGSFNGTAGGNSSPTFTARQSTSTAYLTVGLIFREQNQIKMYSNGVFQSAGFIEQAIAGPSMKQFSNNYVQLGGMTEVAGQVPLKLYGANGTFIASTFEEF